MLARILTFLMLSRFALSGVADASKEKATQVRVFSWWDYVSEATRQRLGKEGYRVEVTVYKTNEEAVSRLATNRDGFDVAIISNLAIPILSGAGVLERIDFSDLVHRRKYLSFLQPQSAYCVPFLWGATLFTYDSRYVSKPPKTIQDLAELKSKGTQIGIIDDMFEFSGRVILDHKKSCTHRTSPKSIFDYLNICKSDSVLSVPANISSADFISSISDLPVKPNTASYGWHGIAALMMDKQPWLQFSLPSDGVVLINDAACVLKGRKNELSKTMLKKFVESLTDEMSTHHNSKFSQYFSPFENDSSGLSPGTKKLKAEIEKSFSSKDPVQLTPPDSEVHSKLNAWWRKLRYGR